MKHLMGTVFDMDGVIVHSNPVHKETIKEFCIKHKQDVSDTFLEERVWGRTNKEWIPEVFGDISAEECEVLADEKEQMFRDRFDPKSAVIPGIVFFLEKLRKQSIPAVVATSAPGENADFILSQLNIRDFFSDVLDSSDVDKGKPEPQVYLKAAERIGLPPSQCIVFEDSLAGVEAGIRAGSKVVGISSTHTPEELSDCAMVISDFNNLKVDDLKRLIE
ncbi:HAD family phosphatase [Rhodohalobacter sp. SW132]|uniref:HAD family hydrolase n=1 Tax=Rhodohalobacter sp. SW132 TaxID=2293433 RepID=UPI000E25535B|nr:HAD family phosphatase [Rhodohalobacter sp. SW132]REL37587.1 HAD family phosphatase [Rhodohalobacter sp. SW132]